MSDNVIDFIVGVGFFCVLGFAVGWLVADTGWSFKRPSSATLDMAKTPRAKCLYWIIGIYLFFWGTNLSVVEIPRARLAHGLLAGAIPYLAFAVGTLICRLRAKEKGIRDSVNAQNGAIDESLSSSVQRIDGEQLVRVFAEYGFDAFTKAFDKEKSRLSKDLEKARNVREKKLRSARSVEVAAASFVHVLRFARNANATVDDQQVHVNRILELVQNRVEAAIVIDEPVVRARYYHYFDAQSPNAQEYLARSVGDTLRALAQHAGFLVPFIGNGERDVLPVARQRALLWPGAPKAQVEAPGCAYVNLGDLKKKSPKSNVFTNDFATTERAAVERYYEQYTCASLAFVPVYNNLAGAATGVVCLESNVEHLVGSRAGFDEIRPHLLALAIYLLAF